MNFQKWNLQPGNESFKKGWLRVSSEPGRYAAPSGQRGHGATPPPRHLAPAPSPHSGGSAGPDEGGRRRLSGCPRVTCDGPSSGGPSRRSSAPARSPGGSQACFPRSPFRERELAIKTESGPPLCLDGWGPNIPQRHDLRPLTSTPEISGQSSTVWDAAPPAAERWPQRPRSGGSPPSRRAGRRRSTATGPRNAPSHRPGTSASGIRRDRAQPPLLRLPIGWGNQQVPGGGDGEAANEISGGQRLGRARQCWEVSTGPAGSEAPGAGPGPGPWVWGGASAPGLTLATPACLQLLSRLVLSPVWASALPPSFPLSLGFFTPPYVHGL